VTTENAKVTPNQVEIQNLHSGLCLTDDELVVGVDTCNAKNGVDLWQMTNLKIVTAGHLSAYHLKNVHYGYCLGSGSTGLGGTGANTLQFQ
jgi:hypothetical protein